MLRSIFRHFNLSSVSFAFAVLSLTSCSQQRDTDRPARRDIEVGWKVRPFSSAPARFRPGGWSSENHLWGLVRGKLTRIDISSGAELPTGASAWWIQAGPDVVAWRNEHGVWIWRAGAAPVKLEESPPLGPDGIGSVLFSPDGRRALLGWPLEWDTRYELLERDGQRRRLETRVPGYFGNGAALWLDSTRVLFHIVASGPVGGKQEYREGGWRGDLALLDLRSGSYRLVTHTPDFTYIRIAGRYGSEILWSTSDSSGARSYWLSNSGLGTGHPVSFPLGRAFASSAGGVVVLLDSKSDTTDAVLAAGARRIPLGRVARDTEPVFSPSGRRGAILTAKGPLLLEAR